MQIDPTSLNVATVIYRSQIFSLGLVYQAQLLDCFKVLAQIDEAERIALSSNDGEAVIEAAVRRSSIHSSLEHHDLYTSCIVAIS